MPSFKRIYLNQKGDIIHEEINRQNMTSWDLCYYLLRAAYDGIESDYLDDREDGKGKKGTEIVDSDGKFDYRYGCTVKDLKEEGDQVRVSFTRRQGKMANGEEDHGDGDGIQYEGEEKEDSILADLVVAADGPSSTIRKLFEPKVQRTYAGYCVIRGTVPEHEASQAALEVFRERFCFFHAPGIQNLTYTIAGKNGITEPGQRLLNFVWYANFPEGEPELETLMTDTDGKRRRITIPPGKMTDKAWESMKQKAGDRLPPQMAEMVEKTRQPFVQCITDVITPQPLFMNDKVVLIGDALAGFRPHTVASTSQAAFDVMTLARWLDGDLDRNGFVRELMQYARFMQGLGVKIGNRSQYEKLPVEEYIKDRNWASVPRKERVYEDWTREGLGLEV